MPRRHPALLALVLAACIGGPYTTTDSTSTTGTTTTGTTGDAGTSLIPTTAATSTATVPSTSTSSTDSTDSSGSTFIVPNPDLDLPPACDTFKQDCPPGEKCTLYDPYGGSGWSASKCVPVMDDPAQIAEPCVAQIGGATGIDDCDLGLICWNADADGNGHCIGFCSGSFEAPICPEGHGVAVTSRLCLCLPACDPLAQDCMPGYLCIANGEGFLCIIDASGGDGQALDPCEYANSCGPGLLCLNASTAEECDPTASGCCQPFCDTTLPNTCPGQGQECIPWYDMGTAPPGYENVGICALPP